MDYIRIASGTYEVYAVLRMTRTGNIIVPMSEYAHVWTVEEQASFIESILMGVSISPIYVQHDRHAVSTVIDGCCRLRAICDFAEDRFCLPSPAFFLKEYAGKRLSELPTEVQATFEQLAVQFKVLEPSTPKEVVNELKGRLNKR